MGAGLRYCTKLPTGFAFRFFTPMLAPTTPSFSGASSLSWSYTTVGKLYRFTQMARRASVRFTSIWFGISRSTTPTPRALPIFSSQRMPHTG